MATKTRLILKRVDGGKLRPAVKDLEDDVNARMDNNPAWELHSVNLLKYTGKEGGRNYLLAAITR